MEPSGLLLKSTTIAFMIFVGGENFKRPLALIPERAQIPLEINESLIVQEERAEMLSALRSVDLVVLLPMIEKDGDYLDLVTKIKPDLIAVTENDLQFENKKSQAKKMGARLSVVSLIKRYSTSKLARILGVE